MSAWQPISTAPRDGSYVLLSYEGGCSVGFWNEAAWDDGDCRSNMDWFTHWMPLPSLPVAVEAA